MHRRIGLVTTAVFIAAGLSACGGGGGTNVAPAPPRPSPSASPSSSPAAASVRLSVAIPAGSSNSGISPSAASIAVTPVVAGATPGPAQAANCAAGTCAVTVSVPAGLVSFEVGLFSGTNGAGSPLSVGSFGASVAPGPNTFSVVFQGLVAKVSVAAGVTTLPIGTAKEFPVTLTSYDAAGNVIAGQRAVLPATIAVAASDPSVTTQGSTTYLTPGSPTFEVFYSGAVPAAPAVTLATNAIDGITSVPLSIAFTGAPPTFAPVAASLVQTMQQSASSVEGFASGSAASALLIVQSDNFGASSESPQVVNIRSAAGTTPLSSSRATRSLVLPTPAPAPSDREINVGPDLMPLWHAHRPRVVARRTAAVVTAPAVGTTRQFEGTTGVDTFVLAAISQHGYIWIAQSLPSAMQYAQQIGALWDKAYQIDTTTFGPVDYPDDAAGIVGAAACDATGKQTGQYDNAFVADTTPGMINVIISDPGPNADVANGFFSAVNFMPQDVANCYPSDGKQFLSAQGPALVNDFLDRGPNNDYTLNVDLYDTFAHELQHLINFVNKGMLRGTQEERWLNEGLGVLAQDYADPPGLEDGLGSVIRIQHFLANSSNVGLFSLAASYGHPYLFVRYLVDRFGDGVAAKLVQSSPTGVQNILQATGQTNFNQLVSDFNAMLALSDTGVTKDPRYQLRTFSIRKTYTSPYALFAGKTYALSGPQLASPLPVGTNVQANILLGTALYIPLQGYAPSGAVVRVDDPSGGTVNLQGALVQS